MIHEPDRVPLGAEQPTFAEAMVGKATIPPGHPWNRMPLVGAVCALLGAVVCAILGPANPKQFFFSWLVSFLFFLSLALGALFFVLIQYAAQGGWGIVLRRIGETTFVMVPVMAVLFLPVLLGLHDLYSWTVPGAADHDALLRWKAPYLNVRFFLIRAALYFGIWSFMALLYYRGSRGQDVSGDPGVSARLRRLAGPAIIVLALTQSFAAIDWIMSLTPHWCLDHVRRLFLRGFLRGVHRASLGRRQWRCAGRGCWTRSSAPSTCTMSESSSSRSRRSGPISPSPSSSSWGTRTSPEETFWYKARMEGSWLTVSLFLMAGHFGAPFLYLMGRTVKRNGVTLAVGGAWVLAMHFVDLYWQVMPTLHPEGFRPSVLDVAALLTVGGCFVAAAGWLMRRQALVPLRDPRLAESLAFENV